MYCPHRVCSCGGEMIYDPEIEGWVCVKCGHICFEEVELS